MEIPVEYNLAGQPWEKHEDEQLIKEYNVDKLSLLDICKIHKRMPGGIISRLKLHNLIDMRINARGYLEYERSELYKEICKNKSGKRTEKRTEIKELKTIQKIDVNKPMFLQDDGINSYTDRQAARIMRKQFPSDVIQLKEDIKEIKEKINKILELMNAVYEFENKPC